MAPSALLAAQSETLDASPVMLLDERKQGAQPHLAEGRSKTRPIRGRREFCLFVKAEVWADAALSAWVVLRSGTTGRHCPHSRFKRAVRRAPDRTGAARSDWSASTCACLATRETVPRTRWRAMTGRPESASGRMPLPFVEQESRR